MCTGQIVVNGGDLWEGRSRVAEMAAGFFADVLDLKLTCDGVCRAGDHVAYLWTFTGTHAGTRNPLTVTGWEGWDLDADGKVVTSKGWFDPDDYDRQVSGAG